MRKFHERFMGLSTQTLCEMWNVITREYFGTSDKNILARYDETMSAYSLLFMLHVMTFGKLVSDDERREKVAEIMNHLRESAGSLKHIEEI